jgi:hypothetical protein
MLARYKGQLKLKDWAFAIAKRSTGSPPRDHYARDAARRDGVRIDWLAAVPWTGG